MRNLDRARGWAFSILLCTASSVTAQDGETCINPVGFTLDATALTQAVTEHAKWVSNSKAGARAILCRLEAKMLDLRGLDLRGIDLRLSKLGHADFSGAKLDGAQFKFADLTQASFRKTSLHKANFYRANLEGVDFSASKGAKLKLRKTNLTGADLRDTKFPGADIGKSTLVDAQVQRSNLRGAKLRKSELTRANFEGANVSEVSFRKAVFRDTALTGATMTSADLRGATFERTSLRGLDLSTVLGLSSGQVAELTTLPLTVPVTPSAPPTLAEEKVPAPKAVATSTMTRERAGPVAKATQKPVKTVKAKIATAGGNGGAKVGYRVQFGSFRNEAIANASSNRFAARHQNAFKGVGIGLERTDYGAPRGTWHRLVSGRLSTKAKAKALCESLKREDSSVHCIVVR